MIFLQVPQWGIAKKKVTKDAIELFMHRNPVASGEFTRYCICKEMGWDYYTYMKQPPFFIEEILIFMLQENNSKKVQDSRSESVKGYNRGR